MANVVKPFDTLKLIIDLFDKDWNASADVLYIKNKLEKWKNKYSDNYFVKKAEKLHWIFEILDETTLIEEKVHLARYLTIYYAHKTPFYVYKHTCPNGKIYIGITCQQNLEDRWQFGTGYKNNVFFTEDIKKYGWNNIKHEILYDKLSQSEASKKECELISYYKTNNPEYGYNLDGGGKTIAKPKLWEYDKFHQWHKKRKIYKLVISKEDIGRLKKSSIYGIDIFYCEPLINKYIDDLYFVKGYRVHDEWDKN